MRNGLYVLQVKQRRRRRLRSQHRGLEIRAEDSFGQIECIDRCGLSFRASWVQICTTPPWSRLLLHSRHADQVCSYLETVVHIGVGHRQPSQQSRRSSGRAVTETLYRLRPCLSAKLKHHGLVKRSEYFVEGGILVCHTRT